MLVVRVRCCLLFVLTNSLADIEPLVAGAAAPGSIATSAAGTTTDSAATLSPGSSTCSVGFFARFRFFFDMFDLLLRICLMRIPPHSSQFI